MLQWEQFNSIQHRAKLIDNFTAFNFTNLYIVITDFGHISKEYSVSCDVSRDYVLQYFNDFNHNINYSEFYAIAEEYCLKYWGYTDDSWFDESMYVDVFEQYIVDNTNGEIGK